MANATIREQVIASIATRLGRIRTAYQFNTECGATVYRSISLTDYTNNLSMPVVIEMYLKPANDNNISQDTEKMLGDVIECLTYPMVKLAYNNGTGAEPNGETLVATPSLAGGIVDSLTTSSGTWAGGDAVGYLYVRRRTGVFASGDTIATASAVAVLTSNQAKYSPVEYSTGDLSDHIKYVSGGVEQWPGDGDIIVGVKAEFEVVYQTQNGNPYGQ
jgi:hypothetical protein